MTNKNLEREYKQRINKSFDFIETNLCRAITLEELASSANFSKYHFHRIFYSFTGETPFRFINRLRLEKAASKLLNNKQLTIAEIAEECGFSDISIFSRNFKSRFQISASNYRRQKSNLGQNQSNELQSDYRSFMYFCHESKTIKWRTFMKLNKSIEIKEMPKMTLAYVRYTGAYKGNELLFENLWNKLFSWAGPRGLLGGGDFKSLIIYHDDPNVTEEEKLRTSVCITVQPDTKVSGEIGKMELEAAQYVVARFELSANDFQEAWEWIYGQWFPQSGYVPDDKPCFELYPEPPKEGKFIVDICVPVKPM